MIVLDVVDVKEEVPVLVLERVGFAVVLDVELNVAVRLGVTAPVGVSVQELVLVAVWLGELVAVTVLLVVPLPVPVEDTVETAVELAVIELVTVAVPVFVAVTVEETVEAGVCVTDGVPE